MAEPDAPTAGGPGGGRRILGMKPTTAYLVFGSALLVGIVAYIIKQRQAAKQQADTPAATPTTVAGDVDYSGQLSVIQTELEALLSQQGVGAGTGGGGTGGWGNGGGSWGGGGDSGGGSGGGGDSGGGGSSGGGQNGGGGAASGGGGSSSAAPAGPSGGHVVSVSNNDAVIAWNPNGAAKWKVVITGPGAINGHTATVGVPQAVYSGLEAGHTYDVTVTPLSSSGTPGPSGIITIKTKGG